MSSQGLLKPKKHHFFLDVLLNILLLTVIFTLLSGLAFASPKHHYRYRVAHYKGEAAPIPAAIPQCTSCPHYAFGGGPYVGASLGMRNNYTSDPSSYLGLEGTLLAGYGDFITQEFYLAGEITVENGMQIHNYRSNSSNQGPKSSWTIGASIIPGYLLTENVLGYFRAGVVRTYFTEPSNGATGGQLGLGLQTALSTRWDLRGEYIYDFYQQVSGTTLSNVKSDQFNLGLIYKFF